MIRNKVIAFGLLFGLCFGANLASAQQPRSCPATAIKKSEVKSVVERRQTTFKHCLACSGTSCELKDWPKEGKDFAAACKLLFCTPTKLPKKSLLPQEVNRQGGVFFTYGISKKGRIQDVELTDIIGDVEESMARKLIKAFFERRRYEPIVIDGVAYELTNLRDGSNYQVTTEIQTN